MGVNRSFSLEELQASYRKLTRIMHPDRHGGTTESNAAFAEVTLAYAQLADSKLKRAYDSALDLITDPCEACEGKGAIWQQVGFGRSTKKLCTSCFGCGRLEVIRQCSTKHKGEKE